MIRPAEPSDVPRINEIRLSVRENRLTDPGWLTEEVTLRALEPPGAGWVWYTDGTIAGFCIASRADDSIWALFVDPAFEGRGSGGALLDRALEWLDEGGADRARLSTDPGTRAEAFYLERGWLPAGTNERGETVLEYSFSGSRLLVLHNQLDDLETVENWFWPMVVLLAATFILLGIALPSGNLWLGANAVGLGLMAGYLGIRDGRRSLRKRDLRRRIAEVVSDRQVSAGAADVAEGGRTGGREL